MKKYFVLYMAKPADFKKVVAQIGKMKPEERDKLMKDWNTWGKGKGVWEMGAPLGQNMRVKKSGVASTRNEIGGYSVVEAKSHAEAAKKMRTSPHIKMFPKGWIDVMEVLPM
jgi:hypothetical protein